MRVKGKRLQSTVEQMAKKQNQETFEKGSHYVIPAKAGIQNHLKTLDSVSSTE